MFRTGAFAIAAILVSAPVAADQGQWKGEVYRAKDGKLAVKPFPKEKSAPVTCVNLDTKAPAHIRDIVHEKAKEMGVDPRLVLTMMYVESNFKVSAVSHKSAQGLMQLIPATAKRFGVKDAFDPEDNIRGGMAYIKWLLGKFNGNVTLALAGFNSGENAVMKHNGVPPYRETRNYVEKINNLLSC